MFSRGGTGSQREMSALLGLEKTKPKFKQEITWI